MATIIKNLTTYQMRDVNDVFQAAYDTVMGSYVKEGLSEIKLFIGELILKEKPYLLATPEGLSLLSDKVFSKECLRDFVLNFTFHFFSRWGASQEEVAALAEQLGRGVSINVGRTDLCAIPKEIANRLSTENDIRDILINNRWLMTILMIQLFITFHQEGPPRSK